MLIDELKMTVDGFFSFLSNRKQDTNLKLRIFYLRLETQQIFPEQNCSIGTYRDQSIQITHYDCISQTQIHNLG